MTAVSFTADELETAFCGALRAGDTQGVDAALRMLATVDPRRAVRLFDALRVALDFAADLDPAS